jgi:hypothetical protein
LVCAGVVVLLAATVVDAAGEEAASIAGGGVSRGFDCFLVVVAAVGEFEPCGGVVDGWEWCVEAVLA